MKMLTVKDILLSIILAATIAAGMLAIHTDIQLWPSKTKIERGSYDVEGINRVLDQQLSSCAAMPDFIDQMGC